MESELAEKFKLLKSQMVICLECNGEGKLLYKGSLGLHPHLNDCPFCNGTGKVLESSIATIERLGKMCEWFAAKPLIESERLSGRGKADYHDAYVEGRITDAFNAVNKK